MAKNLKLKAARAALDMTQADLAAVVGVSRQTINAIEKGEYNPKTEYENQCRCVRRGRCCRACVGAYQVCRIWRGHCGAAGGHHGGLYLGTVLCIAAAQHEGLQKAPR